MAYKVTQKVTQLVEDLFEAGYDGEATLTTAYCTGTKAFFQDCMSVQLTGFCKESLHLAENTETGEITCVGRYSLELEKADVTVPDIVSIAWEMYKEYKEYSNWAMPDEWKDLFLASGYVKEVKVTKTVIVENQ